MKRLNIAPVFAAAARAAPLVIRDLAGVSGAGAIAYGAWLVYAPAGFIAGGVLAMAGAFLLARADT